MGAKGADSKGHRQRLRDRLLDQGGEALGDHELVEYLLCLTLPRIDTKPIARRLLNEFDGLERLLAADAETIKRIGGVSESAAAAIKIAEHAAVRLLRKKAGSHILSNWSALIDYLHAAMAHQPIEQVRVLFLNAKNELIRDELMWDGAVDEAAVHVREVVRRAMDLRASALIIVHNHPSGDPTPSQQDIRLTRDLIEAARHLGIQVHDHVVIGATGHASLRAQGLVGG